MNDVPQIVEINEIIEETPTIKTFVFDWDMDKFGVPSPGEFVMVWNFHNEKPMSISLIDKENSRMAISVKNVGEFSSQLHDLKVGDKIGIRGSYGNGFSNDLTDKKVLAIGGLKEKSIGAHRNGIRTIIIPYDNLKDLDEIPEDIRNDINYITVKNYKDVIKFLKKEKVR